MYSFGVLMLEIATGLKPAEVQGPGGLSNTLVNAVRESYDKGEILSGGKWCDRQGPKPLGGHEYICM
jgi:hypothetical protein